MINGTCHCGAVSYTFSGSPEKATSCNCSICRRLGALWIYSERKNISFTGEDSTLSYAYGDKNIAFHSCRMCGCTTHYSNLKDPAGMTAVNLQMADPEVISKVTVRNFDGADTWAFVDD